VADLADEYPDGRTENLLQHLYVLVYGHHDGLGLCGCGDPDAGIALAHELLTAFGWGFGDGAWQRKRAVIGRLLPTAGVEQVVLSTLDRAGLIDHGSSIGGSWLTDRGKWWLWAVTEVGGLNGLDDRLCQVGYPHGGEDCTDACFPAPDGWRPDGAEPEPEGTPLERVSAIVEEQAQRALAGMTREQRQVWEEQQRAMENLMLYGTLGGSGAPQLWGAAPKRLRFNQQTKTWEQVVAE
jgi:hypothetical protein